MTPGARVQAAIELLDAIIVAARDNGPAADTLIARYFAIRRYAGSKDRRAVRELVYAAIRRAGERPDSGRAALAGLAEDDRALVGCFTGAAHAPLPLAGEEPRAAKGVAPPWLIERLRDSELDDGELAALSERAPLDVRVNTLRGNRDVARSLMPEAAPLSHTAHGLRLPTGYQVEQSEAFRSGLVEVQDEGSQVVSLAAKAMPGMAVVDLCAGAGGKSLALGATMANRGQILACDIDRARLSRLPIRAARAGASIITTRLLNPGHEAAALDDWSERADVVLVDAPCSGTGTWRRNPEARWRLTPARLDRLIETQANILELAAPLVKPGGTLVHVVCSLLDAEGSGQVSRFLEKHPHWTAEMLGLGVGLPRGQGVRLTPARDGTDGFFVARLVRAC